MDQWMGWVYLNDHLLLIEGNTLQCFLDYAASVHLQGQGLDMRAELNIKIKFKFKQ